MDLHFRTRNNDVSAFSKSLHRSTEKQHSISLFYNNFKHFFLFLMIHVDFKPAEAFQHTKLN